MYNNANNTNPLFSLLGMMGGQGGGQQGGGQPQPQPQSQPQQGGMDQSNPLIQLLTAMMGGQNPMNALQNVMPAAAQYTQNNRGNQSMEQFVRNEYNNRGVDINGAMETLQQLMNTMNANNTYGGNNSYNGQMPGHISNGGNTGNTNNTNNTNNNY